MIGSAVWVSARAFARETAEALEPYASGRVFVNMLGVEGEERVRPVALKNEYDPTNLLRLNQNIKPSA